MHMVYLPTNLHLTYHKNQPFMDRDIYRTPPIDFFVSLVPLSHLSIDFDNGRHTSRSNRRSSTKERR